MVSHMYVFMEAFIEDANALPFDIHNFVIIKILLPATSLFYTRAQFITYIHENIVPRSSSYFEQ